MISRQDHLMARSEAMKLIARSGLVVTEAEQEAMDTADFGLGRLRIEGAQIISWFDTPRVSARVIALFAGQTEPEHWHVSTTQGPGKEETLRVLFGELFLYLPGEGAVSHGIIPKGKEEYYTARSERVLAPAQNYTVAPGTKHWFQAGSAGAVILTLSTRAVDDEDLFTDPQIVRRTVIVG